LEQQFCISGDTGLTTAIDNIDDFTHIMFFVITVAKYRTNDTDVFQQETLAFSDSFRTFTDANGVVYQPLGPLISISETASEIQIKDNSLTFSIAGIPDIRVKEIINSEIKGSRIEIQRQFWDNSGNQITDLDIGVLGNVGRFFGYINNYSIVDDIDPLNKSSTVRINFECNSLTNILKRTVRGLRTNPKDLRYLTNDQDESFDRVPILAGENFIFGVPE
jgi:hypothetical protein